MTARINPVIFREYDIRGHVGQTLHMEDAHAIARAFAAFVKPQGAQTICVGYDGRLTSPDFEKQVVKGLADSGLDVICIGLGPTPLLSFAIHHMKADGGIMITGSHNPAAHNGFKMTGPRGSLHGAQIQELKRLIDTQQFIQGQGAVTTTDIRDAYCARLLADLTNAKPLTIAWDCGNGASGDIVRMLTAQLPGTHHLLFDEIDGTFPNHHPDPTVDANLADLVELVRAKKCDLGIAFDGDGDRIGAVDAHGAILRCDTLLALYARDILKTHPGAPIVGDIKCSTVLFDDIKAHGGQPVMWKTGHSLIKSKMRELNAPLAGELSGHIFFADRYYGFDDGLYAAIRLINLLADTPLHEQTAPMRRVFNTPEIRFDVDDSLKFGYIDTLKQHLKTTDVPFIDTDGVRVETPDGWWLIRASNTQNALVARLEAWSETGLENIRLMMAQCLTSVGITCPDILG